MSTPTIGDATPLRVGPKELFDLLVALLPSGISIILWGGPGQGKSTIVNAVAERLELSYSTIHAGIYERVDLVGIPYTTPRPGDSEVMQTEWAIPSLFPDTGDETPRLINFEELTTAKPDVVSALMQLFLDKSYGRYALPKNTAIIACANRQGDRAATHKMPSPMASRVMHFELETGLEEWLEWADANGIDTDVYYFLKFNKENFNTFDPDVYHRSGDYTYACPRSWELLSKAKQALNAAGKPENSHSALITYAGCVGRPAAAAFSKYLELKEVIPDPAEVLRNPDGVRIPVEDPTALYVLCYTLFSLGLGSNREHWPAITQFAMRLNDEAVNYPEHSEFLISQYLRADQSLENTAEFFEWSCTVIDVDE